METRVRAVRAERGWTVRRLAEESGVDKNTISEAERGLRKPNPITMHKLARALGVEVADLFPKSAAPPPSPRGRRRREFLEHIKTLDREALAALSDELDEQLMSGPSGPEYEDVVTKGLMVRMQMRIVDNPDARFEPAEAERKLAVLAGAL